MGERYLIQLFMGILLFACYFVIRYSSLEVKAMDNLNDSSKERNNGFFYFIQKDIPPSDNDVRLSIKVWYNKSQYETII